MKALDQIAHFSIAFGVVAMLVSFPGMLTGGLAGLALGLVREITEDGAFYSKGSLVDLLFWSIGGTAAGLVFTGH